MSMNRPPYFAFYPADFANDINVESMSTLQVGAYILLLCKAWQAEPPASLPSDDAVLARLARVELAVWLEIKDGVLVAFRPGTDGRLHSKRLRLEYDKASRLIRDKSKAGQKGAEKRWCNSNANGSAIAEPLPRQCQGNANQKKSQNKKEESVSSKLTAETAAVPGKTPPSIPPADPPSKEPRKEPPGAHHGAIREFCDRWAAKYSAKYPFNSGKDAAAVKWMLGQVDGNVTRLTTVFERFFEESDPFYAAGDRHSLAKLRQHFARWLVGAPIATNPRLFNRADAEAEQLASYAQDAFGDPA